MSSVNTCLLLLVLSLCHVVVFSHTGLKFMNGKENCTRHEHLIQPNPLLDENSAYVECNNNPFPYLHGYHQCEYQAGAQVDMGYWMMNGREIIVDTHYGYCAAYIARNDAKIGSKKLKWIKIAEGAQAPGNRTQWMLDWMRLNKKPFSFKLPADIPDGTYYIRGECVALHRDNGQFYSGCADVKIVGGKGKATCAGPAVTIPGYINKLVDIKQQRPSRRDASPFKVPGPQLGQWTSGNSCQNGFANVGGCFDYLEPANVTEGWKFWERSPYRNHPRRYAKVDPNVGLCN